MYLPKIPVELASFCQSLDSSILAWVLLFIYLDSKTNFRQYLVALWKCGQPYAKAVWRNIQREWNKGYAPPCRAITNRVASSMTLITHILLSMLALLGWLTGICFLIRLGFLQDNPNQLRLWILVLAYYLLSCVYLRYCLQGLSWAWYGTVRRK